ncbi:MAG: hypothetical protein A3I24_04040 [Candidatus Harrisonbacteria bacterium RIFCSPLOWO2_02_FULL_41_13b]|uniref:Type II secretion system protein GspF domain-containing protein n=1 Tax=Candidatus Harrisonbacteria bacterium RIFCSPLOWO2_02_FULL_41_13b TaxID=1798409 RepID=A0A1G1ZQL5_9BACT|nr:MAG: hypothetical protein A3J53_00250 [Candidatus Harrisonbacteria bacterium RIFCSPHIGHO2_02_FULL_40_20]OGY66832.1 MAG: hypothetical protein A3I24_04040 [Candidatus Harrisonbacteria bacterium RIFCSPLOWO2_02_FULL_41_13b]
MRFKYTASQLDGKLVEGEIESQSTTEILVFLGRKGLRPVSITPLKGIKTGKKLVFFGQSVSVTDKVFLTKYISLMLSVGTDLLRAIDILVKDFNKPVLRGLLQEIKSSLEKGQPFYATFEKYPKYFSPVFVNLVKAGEASGNLEIVFQDLSISLQRDKELQTKIRSALFYPALLFALSIVILVFLVTFAIPKIAEVFGSSGVQPPLFSRVVFVVGLFLNQYIWFILGGLAVLIVAALLFFRSVSGYRVLNYLFNIVPVVGAVSKKIALQRFAGTLSILMRSGLPIIKALEITADTLNHHDLSKALKRIANEGISKGLTLGEAFRREAAFPAVVSNLVAISEKAGHLDGILKTLSDFYDSEIDSSLKVLVSFLEPALLLMIGVVVGLIALSIIVPIYQLVGQF